MSGRREAVIVYNDEDIEWEEPAPRMQEGPLKALAIELAKMTPVLKRSKGKWAVLDTYEDDDKRASTLANQLRKKFPIFEFAGRKMLDGGGSKLYVRVTE